MARTYTKLWRRLSTARTLLMLRRRNDSLERPPFSERDMVWAQRSFNYSLRSLVLTFRSMSAKKLSTSIAKPTQRFQRCGVRHSFASMQFSHGVPHLLGPSMRLRLMRLRKAFSYPAGFGRGTKVFKKLRTQKAKSSTNIKLVKVSSRYMVVR